ncbi:SDR family oxidoreductase [Paraburkholderia sp. UCT31]|uniref:SDR family oxidoreductase n=1 Tax=Paraburkholderia sp. UCT31 TaxID=2615209 RepID=UPI0016551166|nr:SDR family oxidoreductase [Paraburkholderia sp. UCT31]MBC8738585.1 SDR family oxidoreductase [Paraburkholderia sp. UCT31]
MSTVSSPRGVALVTGGARRLGREIALGLARAGWDVCIHYRHSRAEAEQTVRDLRALGRRAASVCAEFASEEEVERVVPSCIEMLGAPRILVNSASTFEYDTAQTVTYGMLTRLMAANVAAPLALAKAVYAALPEEAATDDAKRGAVINLLDQKLWGLNPDHLSYTLTKAALHAATSMLALSLAPKMRVVGVAPGLTMRLEEQAIGPYERAHKETPLGRSSRPEDIVAAVCYLADAPSATDTVLVVDGGQHLWKRERDTLFAE